MPVCADSFTDADASVACRDISSTLTQLNKADHGFAIATPLAEGDTASYSVSNVSQGLG